MAVVTETLAPPLKERDSRTVLRREPIRLSAGDRAVLGWWTLAHAALAVLVWAAAWISSSGKGRSPVRLQGWDAALLQSVAAHGYLSSGSAPNSEAFFPGYPLALAAVHLLVRSWTAAGLLLSFAAGAAALVALSRLAGDRRAAGYLLAAPAAVFLAVGYSESLFLAFAVCAWLAAVRGRWTAAGLLAFGAALTRPDGLFLIPALAVLAWSSAHRWRALVRLAPSLLAPALYEAYLVLATGRADAWMRAQQVGWSIHFAWPWKALELTWRAAFEHRYPAQDSFAYQVELLAMAAGLIGTALLVLERRWAEALYTGLLFVSLACTTWYQGVPRALLVAFPLWALLARSAARRPWIGQAYLAVSAPLAAVFALLYLTGGYAG